MDPINIFKDTFIKHKIEGSMDLRITVTHKGIKINTGLGTNSNKPTTFDLNEAMKDSLMIALRRFNGLIEYYKEDGDMLWHHTKRKAFVNDVLKQL